MTNITRTDSSLWEKIDALSKLSSKEMLAVAQSQNFRYSQETLDYIRTNPHHFTSPSSITLNQVAVNLVAADKPVELADLMKGGISVR